MNDVLKQKISESNVKPYFADEILISANIKARKTKKSVEKEGMIRLLFMNITNNEPISEIVLSRFTAERLLLSLNDSLKKLDKELKNKKMPNQKVIKGKKLNYMG